MASVVVFCLSLRQALMALPGVPQLEDRSCAARLYGTGSARLSRTCSMFGMAFWRCHYDRRHSTCVYD